MNVVLIGGTGHVGTYLTPRLVSAGHNVTLVSRGQRDPYLPHGAFAVAQTVTIDRKAEEAAGTFGERIAALQPDVVIDMICYTPESARQLVDALRGKVQHFLSCGTVWVHGPTIEAPLTEEQPRRPFGDYGILKAETEAYLLKEARLNNFPATVLHPGHIVGPGWVPLNPQANFNPDIYVKLARGQEVTLANIGMETVHHVHADDVAQIFMQAIANRSAAIGESFHAVSPAAVTLRGYAETVAGWFGQQPNLKFLPWDAWKATVSEDDAAKTWDHIAHSPNCSIDKARRLLNYQPRYRSLEAVYESVMWLVENKVIEI